jgi:hypothetical protein
MDMDRYDIRPQAVNSAASQMHAKRHQRHSIRLARLVRNGRETDQMQVLDTYFLGWIPLRNENCEDTENSKPVRLCVLTDGKRFS